MKRFEKWFSRFFSNEKYKMRPTFVWVFLSKINLPCYKNLEGFLSRRTKEEEEGETHMGHEHDETLFSLLFFFPLLLNHETLAEKKENPTHMKNRLCFFFLSLSDNNNFITWSSFLCTKKFKSICLSQSARRENEGWKISGLCRFSFKEIPLFQLMNEIEGKEIML